MIGPGALFQWAWLAWIASWTVAAFWAGRTESRARTWEARLAWLPIAIGLFLLWYGTAHARGAARLWHMGLAGAYALAAATILGLLFTWWARIHLGRLWSGGIVRKEGHRIVESGPYAIVRHPIYGGVIVALAATAVAAATVSALAGVAVMVLGFWLKARAEEHFLASELGAAAYRDYRGRVPMLLPRLRRRR